MTRPKSSLGFSAVEVIIVLFVLCVIGLAAWLAYAHDTSSAGTAGVSQQATLSRYRQLYTQLKDKLSQQQQVTVSPDSWAAQAGSGAILSANGYDYSVSSEMFPGLRIGAQADNNSPAKLSTPVQNAINSVMTKAGYTISSKQYHITGYASGDTQLAPDAPYTAYENKENICLSTYTSGIATFSCFTHGDVMNALAEVKPFVTAYRIANGGSKQPLTFGPLTIKSKAKSGVIGPSRTAGYDISEAVIAGHNTRSVAIYYKKASGPWVYVTKAMDEFGFSCKAYAANPDASKALYGQVCLGPSGQIHFGTGTKATQ